MSCRSIYFVLAFVFMTLLGLCWLRNVSGKSKTDAVEISHVRVERINETKIGFSLSISNVSTFSIYYPGDVFTPDPDLFFLEKWREEKGWQIVAPCIDSPPTRVLELKPGRTIDVESLFETPLPSTCEQRDLTFDGKFRFRLDYFANEKEARSYIDSAFFKSHRKKPLSAISEPFEVPALKK